MLLASARLRREEEFLAASQRRPLLKIRAEHHVPH